MTPTEIDALLMAWGRVYGERPPVDETERDAPATHPLARAMEHAPGDGAAIIRQRTSMDRGGADRRRTMAAAAGCDMRILPAHFVDHIACTETRGTHRSSARDWPIPPAVLRVNEAAMDLESIDPLRGVCLRMKYWRRGRDEDRAFYASEILGHHVTLRVYRDSVSSAKIWIAGRLVMRAA